MGIQRDAQRLLGIASLVELKRPYFLSRSGYTPTPERLGHIVDMIENFLHRAFVLTHAAEDIRKSTPARTKRP